jgi:hypothetical protein
MIHGSAAIINQGGGFLEQSRQGQCWPEKGTQFCSKQHLACEIGPRPAQLATRPVFWPPVLGPGFSGRAPGAPNRVPGSSGGSAWSSGRVSSGRAPGPIAYRLPRKKPVESDHYHDARPGRITRQGPRYTGHGPGPGRAGSRAWNGRLGQQAAGLDDLRRPAYIAIPGRKKGGHAGRQD